MEMSEESGSRGGFLSHFSDVFIYLFLCHVIPSYGEVSVSIHLQKRCPTPEKACFCFDLAVGKVQIFLDVNTNAAGFAQFQVGKERKRFCSSLALKCMVS